MIKNAANKLTIFQPFFDPSSLVQLSSGEPAQCHYFHRITSSDHPKARLIHLSTSCVDWCHMYPELFLVAHHTVHEDVCISHRL